MENLPIEMIESILLRIDCSLKELFELSLVCRQWYLSIHNQSFLNRFFKRRYSRRLPIQFNEILWNDELNSVDDCPDRVIPCQLRLSTILHVHNNNRYVQSISHWPSTVLSSSFSLSCWIWIPQYTYSLTFDLQPCDSKRAYLFLSPSRNLWCVYSHGMQFTGQCQLNSEEWILLVVNCFNSSICSLWINDMELKSESERTEFHHLSHRDDTFLLRCSNGWEIIRHALIVDLHLFPFCLLSHEIETLFKQKTSFHQVKMGQAIFQKMKSENH